MKNYRETLEQGNCYHIFNHSVGKENIFVEERNYLFFLEKFEKYFNSLMKVYAYCLMPNHFHFLLKVNEINSCHTPLEVSDSSQAFKSFFTSYTNSFNKYYNRKGSLFEPRFKRLLVKSDEQLINTIIYIHNNPVSHGFVNGATEWNFSSYNQIINKTNPSWLVAEETIYLFDDISNFIYCHQHKSLGDNEFIDL